MSDVVDQAVALFEREPELLVAAVWHVAAKHYQDRETQMDFVNAYITARKRRDEYRREKEE